MTSSGPNLLKDIMTEDDTFNALRRISFSQLYAMWLDSPFRLAAHHFYEQHGWTYDEFYNEYYKRLNNRS
jgi:hypothetical protein